MPRNPEKPQVDELERTIAELEQRVARLTALHRVAQSMATTPTASRVLVELARELGAAIPRVCEVSVSEWDRRRGVIRDIFEFNPRLGRRVPLASGSCRPAGRRNETVHVGPGERPKGQDAASPGLGRRHANPSGSP